MSNKGIFFSLSNQSVCNIYIDGLDSDKEGVIDRIDRRNIIILRYGDDVILLTESSNDDLKQLMMRVKEKLLKQDYSGTGRRM